MPMKWKIIVSIFIVAVLQACNEKKVNNTKDASEIWIEMLVEIPAGTIEKYELNKTSGQLQIDSIDGEPRWIEYLGYPGNYGMITKTILPKNMGGDGDPLDVIAIGPPVPRGSKLRCKLIGVLQLKDQGEQDDKLIAISGNSNLKETNSIDELKQNYPGILEIIEIWFTNYKGSGKMKSDGYQNKSVAQKLYLQAKQSYDIQGE